MWQRLLCIGCVVSLLLGVKYPMLELEALLLGLEPITALAVGVGTLVVVPAIGAVGSAVGANAAVGSSVTDSSRSIAKTGLVWVFDAFDKTQAFFAEAAESFQDLVAEARTELNTAKARDAQNSPPHPVEIG